MQLTQPAEALRHPSLIHFGLHGRGRYLQSHYLSSIPSPTCNDLAAPFPAQVSLPLIPALRTRLTFPDHSLSSSWPHSLFQRLSLPSVLIPPFIPQANSPSLKFLPVPSLRPSTTSATTRILRTWPSMAYIRAISMCLSTFLNYWDPRPRFCSSCVKHTSP